MSVLDVLRVFVGEDGAGGNPLGVFLRGWEVPARERQAVAADLGFSETVFVDDPETGRLRIFTPGAELPFAGHPLVGTAWLLRQRGFSPEVLRPPAGEVPVRERGGLTFVRGRPEWAPEFELRQLASAEGVTSLSEAPEDLDLVGAWAWEDEASGSVRARVFARRFGIQEDEATGAHAVRLADRLGRGLRIRQGAGSLILAEPLGGGLVEIGGRVEHVQTRDYGGTGR